MTETETRQFLVKHLVPAGFSVERNESGATNEGYPDLTIAREKESFLLELKQGHTDGKGFLHVAKYQPRQRGKMATVATTQVVRILVTCPDKTAFLLSAPYQKLLITSKAIKWSGMLDKDCRLADYLVDWMGWF